MIELYHKIQRSMKMFTTSLDKPTWSFPPSASHEWSREEATPIPQIFFNSHDWRRTSKRSVGPFCTLGGVGVEEVSFDVISQHQSLHVVVCQLPSNKTASKENCPNAHLVQGASWWRLVWSGFWMVGVKHHFS